MPRPADAAPPPAAGLVSQQLLAIERKVDELARRVAGIGDDVSRLHVSSPWDRDSTSSQPEYLAGVPRYSQACRLGHHLSSRSSTLSGRASKLSDSTRNSGCPGKLRSSLAEVVEGRPRLNSVAKHIHAIAQNGALVSADSTMQKASPAIADILMSGQASQRSEDRVTSMWRMLFHASTAHKLLALDTFMSMVAIANVVVLGVSADIACDWVGWLALDSIFVVMFVSECLLRLSLLGGFQYFLGSDRAWHIMELIFTAAAILELYWGFFPPTSGSVDTAPITVFRIVRLMRIGRILRVGKLSMFAELAVMINGTIGGLKALMSSCLIICLALYAVALAFREGLSRRNGVDVATGMFDSVGLSFFTVFRCMVGGDCAQEDGKPLFWHIASDHGWGFAGLYVMSTFFLTFGLFNVIVAIFVENVVASARTNEALIKRQRSRDKVFFASKMTQLVELISALHEDRPPDIHSKRLNQSASARAELFHRASQIEITPELFERLRRTDFFLDICGDLDVADEDHFNLFETLDTDSSGSIDITEFVEGISRLRGGARRSDIVGVSFLVQRMIEETEVSFQRVYRTLGEMKGERKK